jgi:hypothetical protein
MEHILEQARREWAPDFPRNARRRLVRDRKLNFPPLPMVDCGGKLRPTIIPLCRSQAMRIPVHRRK